MKQMVNPLLETTRLLMDKISSEKDPLLQEPLVNIMV